MRNPSHFLVAPSGLLNFMPDPKYKNNFCNTTDMPTSQKNNAWCRVPTIPNTRPNTKDVLCTNNVKSTALNSSKQTHRYYHTHPNAEHVPKKYLLPNTKYTMMIIILLVMIMAMVMMMCRAESCCGLISRAAELNLSTVSCSSVNDVNCTQHL